MDGENNNVISNSRKNNISLEKIQEDLETIKYALIGNELTKDGGLIRRVEELEKDLDIERLRVSALEKYRDKMLWIMVVIGAIPTTIGAIQFVLNMINSTHIPIK